MGPMRQTAAQKRYSVACDAARAWAASCAIDDLRFAPNDRIARSYGIKPSDASKIIADACRTRGL